MEIRFHMVGEDVADVVAKVVDVLFDEEGAVAVGGVFLAAHEGDGGGPALSLNQVNALDEGAGHGHGLIVRPTLQHVECQKVRLAAQHCAGEDVADIGVGQGAADVVAVEVRTVPAGRCGPDLDDGPDPVVV